MRLARFAAKIFVLLPLLLPCESSIPEKVCTGDVILDSSNIDSFKDCTIIDGHLIIRKETFTGQGHIPEMGPSKLEVFNAAGVIIGCLHITASHPNFTDLHYFESLRSVFDVDIVGTSLKFLGLRSLKKLGDVHIGNNSNLCFAESINWPNLMNSNQNHSVENNKPKAACVADNMVCHKECSEDGCWGPSDEDCLSCKSFSLGGKCIDSCNYEGIFQSGDKTCAKCHAPCKKCTGYGSPSVCNECAQFRFEEKCVGQCPNEYYVDCATMMCIRCSSDCKGCRGPRSDQCESCRNLKVPLGDNITHEFYCSDKCPEDKPYILKDRGGPYCSDKKTSIKIRIAGGIVGGVVACMFLIGGIVAAYRNRCWLRTCLRGNTGRMRMETGGLEESVPLNTPHVDPNPAQLGNDEEGALRNEGIPGPSCATDEPKTALSRND